MVSEKVKNKQIEEVYEIENRKYTVVTRSIENSENKDKLLQILCEYVVSKLRDRDKDEL